MLNTVLFDLDGTLVEHGHALLPGLLAGWGLFRPLDDVKWAVSTEIHWFYNHVAGAEEQGWVEDLHYQFYQRVLAALDIADANGTRARAVLDFFNGHPVPPLFDDVTPVVRHLATGGWRMGIITQRGREGVHRFLQTHALQNFFPVVIAGDDGFGRKPSCGPFLSAIDQLETTPQQAVFVGDRIDDDCEGAAGAGLGAFLIDRDGIYGHLAEQRTDFVHLRDLADLLAHLPEKPLTG